MRLFINQSTFLSIIKEERGFNCQIMTLVHGVGMHPATIMDNQKDVVSCIVHEGFTETSKICKDLKELSEFHLQCMMESELAEV